MKFLLATLFVVGAIAFTNAQAFGRGQTPTRGQAHHNSEQARKSEEKIRRCEKQEHATEADMKEFFTQQKPTTQAGKCLHACLMESIGLIVNGVFSVENSNRFMAQMAQGNKEVVKIIEDVSRECENIQDSDRCELAYKIMSCTEEGINKRQDDLRKYAPQNPQRPQRPQ